MSDTSDRERTLAEQFRIFSNNPDLSLESLALKPRTSGALIRAGFDRVGSLATLTDSDLLRIETFGKVSLKDLKHTLGMESRAPAIPDTLPSRAIKSLNIYKGAKTALLKAGFKDIKELEGLKLSELSKVPRLGARARKSIYEACVTMQLECTSVGVFRERIERKAMLANNSQLALTLGGESSPVLHSDFMTELRSQIDERLSPRQKRIVTDRLGINGKALTLQEIADETDVTRERVRQIVDRFCKKMHLSGMPLEKLCSKLSEAFVDRRVPLAIDSIPEEHLYFAGLAKFGGDLDVFFQRYVNSFSIVKALDVNFILNCDRELWDEALKVVKHTKDAAIKEQWAKERIIAAVSDIAITFGIGYMQMILEEIAFKELHINSTGKATVVGVANTLPKKVMFVLEESETPIHYAEIAERINARFAATVPANHVCACMNRTGAILLGRGIYGLERHIPISKVQYPMIRKISRQLMETNPNRQWHSREILRGLKRKNQNLSRQLDFYIVSHVLEGADAFTYLGRQIWALSDSVASLGRGRYEIADLIQEILEVAGRPLTTREIKDEILKTRGIGKTFQIHPTEKVVSVGQGRWGLIGRDVLPSVELAEIISTIYEETKRAGGELTERYLSERLDAGEIAFGVNVTAPVILSLVSLDSRMGVTKDATIVLR